jgi:hypothetical protein
LYNHIRVLTSVKIRGYRPKLLCHRREKEVRKENAIYMTMSTHDNVPLQMNDIRKDLDRIERTGRL